MSEEKKYVFASRKSFADLYGTHRDKQTGKCLVTTLRNFVDQKIDSLAKEPIFFIKVSLLEFFEDCRDNYLEPKYLKLLGWQYPEACRLIEEEKAIFITTTHPRFESRLYSFAKARDDDEYCFRIIQEAYEMRGGSLIRFEYDPEIHTPDWKYVDPRKLKKMQSDKV